MTEYIKKMDKIQFKSNIIRYTKIKGYIFELQSDFNNMMYTSIWINNPEYGIKMHCISAELTEDQIQQFLKNESDDYIKIYKKGYEND